MGLKRFLFGDKVTLPRKVKQRINENKKENESYQGQFFFKVKYGENYYYYVQYSPSNQGCFIKENEMVPALSEIYKPLYEDVIWIAFSINSKVGAFQDHGKRWSKQPSYFHKRVLKILKRLHRTFRHKMPNEIEGALESFYLASDTFIKKQQNIRENYNQGKIFIDQLFRLCIVTKEDQNELEQYHDQMVRSAYWQSYYQVKTYQERQKVIDYMQAEISIFQPALWLQLMELKFNHNRMLNRKKMNREEIKFMEEQYERMSTDTPVARYEFYNEALAMIRNRSTIKNQEVL